MGRCQQPRPWGLLLSIPELKRTSTTEVDAVSRFIFLLGTFTSSLQLKPIPLLWHPNFSFSLLPQIQQQGTSSCQHDLTFLINPFLLLEWIDKQIKKCMAMLQCIQLNPEEKELHQSTTPAHGRQSGSNAEIHLLSGQIHRNTDSRLNLQ
ncbi:uncharacterized protein [Lolium perenne]|uniref:uncharacterized protein isoform X4 n=1 Tax=Lolium perenne TaxID=4522 RepID=UPI003A98FC08